MFKQISVLNYFSLQLVGILLLIAFQACAASSASIQDEMTPAFPGAMGGGKYTTGGRGGKVIKVINLNDDGPGSLRKAIKAKGPRTIVFEVSGNIILNSQLTINNGDLTIAGQTAPGEGICIQGHEVRINADNVIIRYLRFRPGDVSGEQLDALTGMRNKNIIIDHCSMSWSSDETVSLYDNENFTLQWCIIGESLNNSVHSKGKHGYGGIWGGKNASFVNNIIAHHSSRNPRLQGTRYQKEEDMEKAELINNLIYNWGDKAIYGGENGRYNLINNIFIPGPASPKKKVVEILEPYAPFGQFYLKGNEIWTGKDKYKATDKNVTLPAGEYTNSLISTPFKFPISSEVLGTKEAYKKLLASAGASLSRDAVDQRIISNITKRTYTFGNMGIIDSQNDTQGWPALTSMPPLFDSDGDGIPDAWETKYGLNPTDPADGNAYTLDKRYTNLEVYINSLVD